MTQTSQRGSYKTYALGPAAKKVALTYPLLLMSQDCAAGLNQSAYRSRLSLLASSLRIFKRWCALKRRYFETICRISLVRALLLDVIIQTHYTRWLSLWSIGCTLVASVLIAYIFVVLVLVYVYILKAHIPRLRGDFYSM